MEISSWDRKNTNENAPSFPMFDTTATKRIEMINCELNNGFNAYENDGEKLKRATSKQLSMMMFAFQRW